MKKIIIIASIISFMGNYRIQSNLGPAALKNLGNTCYMNSTLQCLYQIEPLTNFLLANGTEFYKPNSIAMEYINFINKIPSGQLDEEEMKKICRPIFKKFFQEKAGQTKEESKKQQDAAEFLQQFLDHLTDEDVKNEKRGSEFIIGTSTKKNPVSELFFLLLQNTITPNIIKPTCIPSLKVEGASKLDLETSAKLPKTNWENLQEYINFSDTSEGQDLLHKTLADCLKAFTSTELLTGDDKYRCLDDDLVEATKTFKIQETAPFLIIVLKRFTNIKIQGQRDPEVVKLKHPISFPLYNLDLKPYMAKDSTQVNTTYDLLSFVQHEGSLNRGHYTSYVKVDNKWYYCDDLLYHLPDPIVLTDEKNIQKIANNGIDNHFTPYILFYKRKDIPTAKPSLNEENILNLQQLEAQLQALAQRAQEL